VCVCDYAQGVGVAGVEVAGVEVAGVEVAGVEVAGVCYTEYTVVSTLSVSFSQTYTTQQWRMKTVRLSDT